MAFDLDLLEGLLHEDEGTSLDFKCAQYPFENASAEKKAELLKDILAFTNSWRRTSAYILIGVKEIRGGRSRIVGVKNHLDDAKLHQFVNSKTQRAVEFSYRTVQIVNLEIGVIEIALQERPVYLKKRYGSLRDNVVYVRDGSSTRSATPDEIAKMGVHHVLDETPQFILEWANPDTKTALPSPYVLHSLVLSPALPGNTFALPRPSPFSKDFYRGERYSEQVISCTFERAFLVRVGFRLYNSSGVLGKNIRFEGSLSKAGGVVVQDSLEAMPGTIVMPPKVDPIATIIQKPSVYLRELEDKWEIAAEFGDIRPSEILWAPGPMWFGCARPTLAKLEGQLIGDNLREPVPCSLKIQFEPERRRMTEDDAEPYLYR